MADNTDDLHPYSLEVQPHPRKQGEWQFTIRLHDKLLQRSDRRFDSEAKARRDGLEVIERRKHGADDGRR